MVRRFDIYSLAMACLLCLSACDDCGTGLGDLGGGGGSPGSHDPRLDAPRDGLFTSIVETVSVEIDYESGAEPFTGGGGVLGGNTWDLFINNLEALFEVHPRQLNVPTSLSGMEGLGNVDSGGDGDFTTQEILAIAGAHRDQLSTIAHRTFYIVFLDGYYRDETGHRSDVLGVSIGETGVIAMFKPVIEGMRHPKRVEQAVLVHELGHAVGLVNNGVPLSVDHQDDEHGAHCDNPDCVMYWLNEGVNVRDLVHKVLLEGNPILFDDDCLSDIHFASAED